MKIIVLLILLFSAFHTNAQEAAMGQMPFPEHIKEVQSFGTTLGGAKYEFGKQSKAPNEDGFILQQHNIQQNKNLAEQLNKLNGCTGPNCMNVQVINEGPTTTVTPKRSSPQELCEKYPNISGCPK